MPSVKILLILTILAVWGCGSPVANLGSKGKTIVCFGDSLTAGLGADPGQDYPSVLRSHVDLPVINAGIDGNTTRDALQRLDKDVLAHDPKIVIITLGGNDFLDGFAKEETLKNMAEIIDRIQAQGAMVVWATVKTGLLGDGYAKDFAKLAREKRIVLIPDILNGIMFNPQYKYDQIHPNSAGYRIMAERIEAGLKPLLK